MAKLTKDQITLLKKWVISPRLVDKITDDTKQVEIRKAKVQCFSLRVFESIFGYDATTGKFTIKGGGTTPTSPTIAQVKTELKTKLTAFKTKLAGTTGKTVAFTYKADAADQQWAETIATFGTTDISTLDTIIAALESELNTVGDDAITFNPAPTAANIKVTGVTDSPIKVDTTALRIIKKADHIVLDVQPFLEFTDTTKNGVYGLDDMDTAGKAAFNNVNVEIDNTHADKSEIIAALDKAIAAL